MITKKEILEDLTNIETKASLIVNPDEEEWNEVLNKLASIKYIIMNRINDKRI